MSRKFKIIIFIILLLIIIGIIIKNIPLYHGSIDLRIQDPTLDQSIENAEVRYEYYKTITSMGFIHGGNTTLHTINEITLFSGNDGHIKLPLIMRFGEGWFNTGFLIRVNKNGYHETYYDVDRPGRFYLADRNDAPRLSWLNQVATLYLFPILRDSLNPCIQITDSQLRSKCIFLNKEEVLKKTRDSQICSTLPLNSMSDLLSREGCWRSTMVLISRNPIFCDYIYNDAKKIQDKGIDGAGPETRKKTCKIDMLNDYSD